MAFRSGDGNRDTLNEIIGKIGRSSHTKWRPGPGCPGGSGSLRGGEGECRRLEGGPEARTRRGETGRGAGELGGQNERRPGPSGVKGPGRSGESGDDQDQVERLRGTTVERNIGAAEGEGQTLRRSRRRARPRPRTAAVPQRASDEGSGMTPSVPFGRATKSRMSVELGMFRPGL